MTHYFPLAIGTVFAGTLLSSCSHSSSTTELAAGASAPTVAAERTTAKKVDSLNGIPGHQFGEPLSAFPGLEPTAGQGEPGTIRYTYPAGKAEGSWFGKHKKEVPHVYYTFKDNKFAWFQAIAVGDGRQALQQEAQFLFGAGKRNGVGTHWAGEKAEAYYSMSSLSTGPAETLDVMSVPLMKAKASEDAARLKAENAP